jgi:hypothetical protein
LLCNSPGGVPRRGQTVVFAMIHHRPPRRVAVMYCLPSRPGRSSVSSAASSQRAASTALAEVIVSRTWAAWPAVISLDTPPEISSPSTGCSRQVTGVRARPRSW